MEKKTFESQITRMIQTWGERHYPTERVTLYWRALQNVFDQDFIEATDLLIGNHRTAPMHEDITKRVEECKTRRLSGNSVSGFPTSGGFGSLLHNAAKLNKVADPDFVKASLQLLRDKLSGKLNHSQFIEGCGYLDTVSKQLR